MLQQQKWVPGLKLVLLLVKVVAVGRVPTNSWLLMFESQRAHLCCTSLCCCAQVHLAPPRPLLHMLLSTRAVTTPARSQVGQGGSSGSSSALLPRIILLFAAQPGSYCLGYAASHRLAAVSWHYVLWLYTISIAQVSILTRSVIATSAAAAAAAALAAGQYESSQLVSLHVGLLYLTGMTCCNGRGAAILPMAQSCTCCKRSVLCTPNGPMGLCATH